MCVYVCVCVRACVRACLHVREGTYSRGYARACTQSGLWSVASRCTSTVQARLSHCTSTVQARLRGTSDVSVRGCTAGVAASQGRHTRHLCVSGASTTGPSPPRARVRLTHRLRPVLGRPLQDSAEPGLQSGPGCSPARAAISASQARTHRTGPGSSRASCMEPASTARPGPGMLLRLGGAGTQAVHGPSAPPHPSHTPAPAACSFRPRASCLQAAAHRLRARGSRARAAQTRRRACPAVCPRPTTGSSISG